MKIGQRIRQLREERGMTQRKLAALLNTGQGYITNIEREVYSPTGKRLGQFAVVFGISVQELMAPVDTDAGGERGHDEAPGDLAEWIKHKHLDADQQSMVRDLIERLVREQAIQEGENGVAEAPGDVKQAPSKQQGRAQPAQQRMIAEEAEVYNMPEARILGSEPLEAPDETRKRA